MRKIGKKTLSFLLGIVMCLTIFGVFPEIKMNAHADFTMRTSAPSTSDARYYDSNPFYLLGDTNAPIRRLNLQKLTLQ